MRKLGDRYLLDYQIGAGGNACVWAGRDELLDRPVALKVISKAEPTSDQDVSRALNEARCAGRLAHPNVAAVYDFGTDHIADEPVSFLVMELLEGQLLQHYLADGPLHPATAIRAAAEIAAGLAAAHQYGIVHRDIKPTNVTLTQTGAKILDFGIAARVGDPDRLTDGSIEGTPAYLAPERLTGEPVSTALDLYSLGVLLYLSLTGDLPWEANTVPQLLRAHRMRKPQPLPRMRGLPAEATRICMACLDKDPGARPPAMAVALVLATSVDAQVYLPPITRADHQRTVPAPDRFDEPTQRSSGLDD